MDFINKLISEPWPWYIGGPLIGLTVIALLLTEKKQLGISSSLVYICAKVTPFNLNYLKNPEKNAWQFWFVVGLVIGGGLAAVVLPEYSIDLSDSTSELLVENGIGHNSGYAPDRLFNLDIQNLGILWLGGVLLGFGARYANGCTAGHAIMGMAQLAPSSILATLSFFAGGLVATFFILPYLF